MKKLIATLSAGAILLNISGCALFESSVEQLSAENAVSISSAQEASNQKCFDRQIKKLENELFAMSKMSQDQAYNWLMMQSMQKSNDNMATVALAAIQWGSGGKVNRQLGECNQTNIWDYLAASDVAKYELVGKVIDGGLRVLNTVLDGVITYYIADGSGAVVGDGGVSLNKSNGNVVIISKDEISGESSKSVSPSNSPVMKTSIQTGTDDSTNDGTGDYPMTPTILDATATGTAEIPVATVTE